MRQIKRIILIGLLIMISLSFCSCGSVTHLANVDVMMTCLGEPTGNELYYSVYPEYKEASEGEKQIKFSCTFTNNEEYDVDCLNIEQSDNPNIKTHYGCLDLEPWWSVTAGEQITCFVYAFVDENLTDEQIEEELKKTTFTFSCFNEDHLNHGAKMYFYGTIYL